MVRAWDRLLAIVDLATSVCVVAMVGIVAVQIILQYLLSPPFVWADELASCLFVWVIFLGSSVLVWRDSHLTVEIIVDRLSVRVNL